MNKKCLIADEMHESILDLLPQIGFEPTYFPNISRAEPSKKLGAMKGS